jgi:hypothetical protein
MDRARSHKQAWRRAVTNVERGDDQKTRCSNPHARVNCIRFAPTLLMNGAVPSSCRDPSSAHQFQCPVPTQREVGWGRQEPVAHLGSGRLPKGN